MKGVPSPAFTKELQRWTFKMSPQGSLASAAEPRHTGQRGGAHPPRVGLESVLFHPPGNLVPDPWSH